MSRSQSQPQYENHLDDQEARWFAVYTRYKREKLVARRLEDKGIEVYLPLQEFTRRYTRKVKKVEIPLINCYIFTKITRRDYVPVLETPDVVKFVQFSRNLISIPESEISIIQRVVGESIEIEVCPAQYLPGDEVEIIAGQLTGLKGKLVSKNKEKNFLIELESLGYQMRMQVDPRLLHWVGRDPNWKPDDLDTGLWNQ
ncbi:MAG: UpxY family transcription antiterminator [Saprospiraceae bacterium]|nr:UpxY family transcription antiterminator [Lewinella sp.]